MQGKHAGGSRSWLPPALLTVVALVAATVLWFQGGGAGGTVSAPPAPGTSATASPVPSLSTTRATRSPEASPRKKDGRKAGRKAARKEAAKARKAAQKAAAHPVAGVPGRVVVRSLGIDAPVVPIAAQGSSLNPPDDPQVLGWWSGGAPTGAVTGTALVTGHTVNAGGGAMDHLEQLRAGAEIEVLTDAGTIRYVAESVAVLGKDEIAHQAQQLFSQEVDGRLVLVTCEDWDGTGYRSNVVVTAVPMR